MIFIKVPVFPEFIVDSHSSKCSALVLCIKIGLVIKSVLIIIIVIMIILLTWFHKVSYTVVLVCT